MLQVWFGKVTGLTFFDAKAITVPRRMKLVHWLLMGGLLHLVQ